MAKQPRSLDDLTSQELTGLRMKCAEVVYPTASKIGLEKDQALVFTETLFNWIVKPLSDSGAENPSKAPAETS